jgi:hypothetical protein
MDSVAVICGIIAACIVAVGLICGSIFDVGCACLWRRIGMGADKDKDKAGGKGGDGMTDRATRVAVASTASGGSGTSPTNAAAKV